MARVAFPIVVQSPSNGSALVGATATITQHVVGGTLGAGPAASIYTVESGGSPTGSNQLTSDSYGRFTQGSGGGYAPYWLAQGTYDVAISGTGLAAFTTVRELLSASQSDMVALAGEVKFGAWAQIPAGFFDMDGSAYSRSSYSALFAALTIQTTGTTDGSTATVTAVPAAAFTALAAIAPSSSISIPVSGPGIASGTTVIAYNSGAGTITLSKPTTAAGSGVALVIAPHGVGDGSTTFNVPNLHQRTPVAADASTYALGATGGESVHTLSVSEMPAHSHRADGAGGSGGATASAQSGSGAAQISTVGNLISDPGHSHSFGGDGTVTTSNHNLGIYDNGGGTAAGQIIGYGGGGLGLVSITETNGSGSGVSTVTHGHSDAGHTHAVPALAINVNGGGSSHNNMQPYLALRGIIRHGLQ